MDRSIPKPFLAVLGVVALTGASPSLAYDAASIFTPGNLGAVAVHDDKPERTLITNVHVFDGKHEQRLMNASVLIEGSLIKEVSDQPISAEDAAVIDGRGAP